MSIHLDIPYILGAVHLTNLPTTTISLIITHNIIFTSIILKKKLSVGAYERHEVQILLLIFDVSDVAPPVFFYLLCLKILSHTGLSTLNSLRIHS